MTADAESILRRFTRSNGQHPTYHALSELGKAQKTIFLCRYLRLEALRQEIHEGLNVIELWNSVNSFIFYGKGPTVGFFMGKLRRAAPIGRGLKPGVSWQPVAISLLRRTAPL